MLSKLTVFISAILCACAISVAQSGPKAPTLKVGDKAPALSVDAWVKGKEFKEFEKDKVYVVEFWATWCKPCIDGIPKLTELQRKYQRDGVTIIGVAGSERGRDNAEKIGKVRNLVRQQGRKMEYSIAFDGDESMWKTWMAPAGRGGIPSAFVVDKQGKISWIGHPASGLDEAISKALKGSGRAAAEPAPAHTLALASWQPRQTREERQAEEAKKDAKKEPVKDEPRPLSVGDPAPPIRVARFLKGDPVEGFEPGKVHVVEFWATWCGPCIAAIPHLTELQEKHAGDVRIVGVSVWEHDLDGVPEFVEKMGEKMQYTVAMDKIPAPKAKTRSAQREASQEGFMARYWMNAAGRDGIPSSFIVDQQGRVAWIGHPGELDKPLEKIIAGDWDLAAAASEYKRRQEAEKKQRQLWNRWSRAMQAGEYEQAVEVLDEIAGTDESMKASVAGQKFSLLLVQMKDYDRAYGFARRAVAELKDEAEALNMIAWTIVDPDHEHLEVRDLELALEAARRADELTEGKSAHIVDTLAKVYFDMGNIEEALRLQEKAVRLSDGAPYEDELRDRLEQYRKAMNDKQRR
jgi:thiol-disulfide isomerase/thioredoxin